MPDHNTSSNRKYDIVIVGGGLAGASLAVALADSQLRVAVVEAFEFDAGAQPSYDERTIALTYSARHIFQQLGVWDKQIENEACALKSIHISNRGHFGMTHLEHKDIGTEALGYVVPTRVLGQALMARLEQLDKVDFLCPYTAQQVSVNEDTAEVQIEQRDTQQLSRLTTELVVIADGGRSPLIGDLGFDRESKAYSQSALLSIVKTSVPHHHRAYERFAADGPLALLPMHGQRFAVVWTLSPDRLEEISNKDDEEYLQALQSEFGMRAGLFDAPTPRQAYPLNKSVLTTPWKKRVLALGNAAHTVHPVAGQGFNLGLRDVAALAEAILTGDGQDIGTEAFLEAYAVSREHDTQRVGQFTDGLLNIFTQSSPLIQFSRNLGLFAVENLPFVKRALLRRTMGLSHRQPRLARGLRIHTDKAGKK